ncbi:hypothetical protein Poli38472_007080 [Pythium oligandrum]|uniref:Uncharacterized protein n=1 Tax=Pythium oligandrum TaxID=41045 RepID=A0A8K1FD09_PYTOL|nr:hypothetical protein Poli38472_007080 [Pythium oligandrum]|eukprot:TMW58935.1 hypothetical protein Poli38472_007080 [Pythium oligandrum]
MGLFDDVTTDPILKKPQSFNLLLPPLPAMIITLLLVTIPLKDPSLGWRANWTFFLREFIGSWCSSFSLELQSQSHVPELRYHLGKAALLNIAHAAFQIALMIALTFVAGVFPVPFTPMITMPLYAIFCWATRIYVARKELWSKTQPEKALAFRTKLWNFIDLMGFMVQIITVYAALATVFSRVPSRYQLLMVMTIQGFKILVRNIMWRKAQLNSQHDDVAAILVATSTQFFHSLFVSTCFQTSKSVVTLLLMVGWNILQDGLSIRSISRRTTRVERLRSKLNVSYNTTQDQLSLMVRATKHNSSAESNCLAIESSYLPYRALAIQIKAQASHTSDQAPAAAEVAWLHKQTELFHCREVLLLRLYMEIIAPIFYLVFVSTLQAIPNRTCMSYLGHVDLPLLSQRIFLQVITRVVLLLVLVHELKQASSSTTPSGLRQLLFITRYQGMPILVECVSVSLFVFGFSVQHNGNDISFRFAWLKTTNATSIAGD